MFNQKLMIENIKEAIESHIVALREEKPRITSRGVNDHLNLSEIKPILYRR
ncbi:MAG: hypothetical protein ACE5KE_04640 [Methanosarcinales archaeon]